METRTPDEIESETIDARTSSRVTHGIIEGQAEFVVRERKRNRTNRDGIEIR